MFVNYQKGEIARMKVLLRAAELGYLVSIPAVEARYDLVIDDGTRLLRVQVKYAGVSQSAGSVHLDLRKNTRGNTEKRVYTAQEVDIILAYIPQIDAVVYIPPEKFDGAKAIVLRFRPTANGQTKGVNYIEDMIW